ncbi:MAG: precorrin-2 C(20)-methyltransferase [Hydrogenoanaerobacterium sp.]
MSGILYGVGVGPGDPELLTLKAVKIINNCAVIAVPKNGGALGDGVALQIAKSAVSLDGKKIIELTLPMTRDKAELQRHHDDAAECVAAELRAGYDVAFLTLGDPTIYSTYTYIHKRIIKMGLNAQFVAGVPSFCAVAARLNIPLTEGAQALHILPASYKGTGAGLDMCGTRVLMKTGKAFAEVKKQLAGRGMLKNAKMVQKCGMEGERVFENLENADEDASYFSVIILKDGEEKL